MAGLNPSRLGVLLLLLSSGFSTLPRRNVSLRGCDAGATVLEGAIGAGFALLAIAVLEVSGFSVEWKNLVVIVHDKNLVYIKEDL
jgi:hypothetical protein